MMNVVKVKDLIIGEGIPKVCLPLIGGTREEILEETKNLLNVKLDLIEWRIDYYEDVENKIKVKNVLFEIREILGNIPLLVTFRSKNEGGEREISTKYYMELNKEICLTGKVDLIDVELFIGDEIVNEIVEFAHNYNVKVIISNHDFNKTPSKEEIIKRLCKMQELNGDLPKIAVMPNDTSDVLTLLCATNEMVNNYASTPIITMSMSGIGAVSRISGEIFGSSLTFGSRKIASAPGQIEVEELNKVLQLLHKAK